MAQKTLTTSYLVKLTNANHDGVVSISDAVGVVNIILNGGGAEAAPAVEEPAESIEAA